RRPRRASGGPRNGRGAGARETGNGRRRRGIPGRSSSPRYFATPRRGPRVTVGALTSRACTGRSIGRGLRTGLCQGALPARLFLRASPARLFLRDSPARARVELVVDPLQARRG